jgi:hypothetical protein
MFKFFVPLFMMLLPFHLTAPAMSPTHRFFKVESIDTMKYSRDAAGSVKPDEIRMLVDKVATLHPTHIAIATPYDNQFNSVLSTWVSEARKDNLNVWFRGNFSAWEGWFDTPAFTNYSDHHKMIYQFVTTHPELFQDGDIFTPLPEPENGGPGDPRGDDKKMAMFNQFLVDSYNNCVKAFAQIHKNVACGYFSTNGDIARNVLTKDTIKKIGNRVVIDHYVNQPEELVADIQYLHTKFDAPVVLGEFGAPIPDIHGEMTDEQQKDYIQRTFQLLAQNKSIIGGINYWTAFGGSTQLFNDDFQPKPATTVVADYYQPLNVKGQVKDVFGKAISGATVSAGSTSTTTDRNGNFSLLITRNNSTIKVSKNSFINKSITLQADLEISSLTQNFTLDYQKQRPFYKLLIFLNHIVHW